MSDETPDTTGRCTGTDCPGCAHARRHYKAHGCLVPNCTDPHPTPDASPDPAVVTPDAGDVSLTDADDVALADWWVSEGGDYEDLALDSLTLVVERIIANHVAAAREADRAEVERLRALADTHREVAESMSAKWQEELDRADRLEAMCDRLAGDRVDREDAAEARAKAADERLAGLVAKIEALDRSGRMHFDHSDLRALIPADAATSLDAVREQAKAEALREMSQKFRTEAAEVWGGNGSWLTTGRKVADLVSFWCDDEADQIENREGATDD